MNKSIISVVLFIVIITRVQAQEEDNLSDILKEVEDTTAVITSDTEEGVSVDMGEIVKEAERDTTRSNDTTNLRLGNQDLTIVEEDDGVTFHFKNPDKKYRHKSGDKFKGHWSGLEFGLNNFVDEEFSISRIPEEQFMDLNTGRSWNVNLNFHQSSLGLIGKHFGLVTGLGFEFNNYFFDGDNSITKDSTGSIDSKPLTEEIIKSKLSTVYLNLPVLLEVQIGRGDRNDRVHLTGGVIGSVKLNSHTKIVYREDKKKEKDPDDYNISPLRIGLTARVGYKNVSVYGNYYLTSLFEKNKGPELYPVSVGLSFQL